MKTIWSAKPPKRYITHEELPGLVRRAIAEIILGQTLLLPSGQPSTGTPAERDTMPTKPPSARKGPHTRVPGHNHRGFCGRECFAGRGPKS
jgi:hypothetical protein